MLRYPATLACLLSALAFAPSEEKKASLPYFDYNTARTHEIKPHRRTIPTQGVKQGFNQLRLTLTISPTGDVTSAQATGDNYTMTLWPQLQGEVYQWKFTPFEKDGKPTTVEVEEYIDLVPPESLPTTHISPPPIKPDSKIAITLERTACFGSCPAYSVTVTNTAIVFEGGFNTVASGRHTDKTDADAVRKLAKRFVDADFYSMSPDYVAGVTDNPTYTLSIDIDGRLMKVQDYVGQRVGMPAVIRDLEGAVDDFARTSRWIEGTDGLVELLKTEHYKFHTFEAQVMLKAAAINGQTATVQQLLAVGVPLQPLPAPKPKEPYEAVPFENVGWLTAAAWHPDALQSLIDAEASKNDQKDKDLALSSAAGRGILLSAQSLLAYGANPNADLSKLIVTSEAGGMTLQGSGSGSILIEAAKSGNPNVVREILRYHPKLELKDREGHTALLAAADEYRYDEEEGKRAECIRLLAKAGANINARDEDGNTALHKTIDSEVAAALIELGADVNTRNNDGETALFTTYDVDAIPLLLRHGADPNLRNKDGQTALEASEKNQPKHEALLTAIRARASSQ